ncbi:MAG: TetR/AcrR family transcriptional regulator [Betaproteobacteria bacterium]|nr:MAG: TetR/AcrR family transcriptional regulator [Betaproteobacteria bacterium]
MAKSLGIAKAGFYWHFKNRDDLLRQLLDYWTHELTEIVTANPWILSLPPKERLIRTADMVLDYELARYDIPIRQWALQDAGVAKTVKQVNRLRLDFVAEALSELGFKGESLEMRSTVLVRYLSMETAEFRGKSTKRQRNQIAGLVDLLTSK